MQSFKQALRGSSLPPKEALQEFLMQYRRIPFASGLSPSELLNGRRIRTKIDTLVPSIPHLLQGRQSRQASKHSNAEDSEVVSKVEHHYSLGDPCYALYFGPRRDRDPRWVPAIVTKVHGTRSVNLRVIPRGPTWRRHLDQLLPRYGSDQDDDPCEMPTSVLSTETLPAGTDHASSSSSMNQRNNPRLPTGDEYATIRDYQPETSTGDTIYDDQREQRDLQKNIVANMYKYFFVVVYLGRCCDIVILISAFCSNNYWTRASPGIVVTS